MNIQPASRVLLLRDTRPTPANPRVRRYRLARLDLQAPVAGEDRFEYLRRSHD